MARIRVATALDRENIHEVHMRAFPVSENQSVATLAIDLLNERTRPETFALVAETNGPVVGHIAFSPVTVDNNEKWKGYILAPLGVIPEHQKGRIGSTLVESGIERLSRTGVHVVFVYGDPAYYSKFGFNFDAASRYSPPYPLQYPFGWQAMTLNESGFAESNAKVSCVASLRNPELW